MLSDNIDVPEISTMPDKFCYEVNSVRLIYVGTEGIYIFIIVISERTVLYFTQSNLLETCLMIIPENGNMLTLTPHFSTRPLYYTIPV